MYLEYIICVMRKLLEFINLCISNPLLPISWGIANICIEQESVTFFVNGCKYQGMVMIVNDMGNLKVFVGESEEIFADAIAAYYWLDQHIE